jgi:hypothetical protein
MRMTPTRTLPVKNIINGQWGYSYDAVEKVMLGGYSEDGKSFTHTFTLYEVEKKDAMFAIALMGLLYGKTREVVTSYPELVGVEDYRMRMLRYDVELHNK